MALPDTGATGFEGFVRDVLTEVSGEAFRLMKSGPQGGVDAIGEPRANALAIGMEGKQYGRKTRLPLDALKSKLQDAASNFPMLDIWVLAVTRSIDGGDTRALAECGNEIGVDVLVLDWPDAGALPPPLAVLCAAAPFAVAYHLPNTPAVLADLANIRGGGFYTAELERLRSRLRDPATGLASTRAQLREWVRMHLRDSASARLAFDSNVVLERTGIRRIARPAIEEALDRWWAAPIRPVALLGMEGMGKSWGLLAWWLAKIDDDPEFPLTLVMPARDIDITDAPVLISRALHRATGVRDAAFWQRRLARWSKIPTDRPLILLVVDGLNQNWRFRDWSDFVVSTQTPTWKVRIATAFTCRPDHWMNRLKSLEDLEGGVETIRVEPFDDAELNRLLDQYGLTREGILPALIELMRRPRLSRLAIERRGVLSDGGEITAERLVYEDWRHRHPGAQRALSHGEFKAFVAELGRTAEAGLDRASLSRTDLLARLTADAGGPSEEFQVVLSELIDGGWLEPDVPPHHFKLHLARVPAALGLTLVADLNETTSPEEAEERYAGLLEPLQDSDLAVSILRNAATFALIDERVHRGVKRMLLERWITAQNFSPSDFEAYWRLVGLSPDLAIDIAETDWFGKRAQSRADEVLVKGFGNAWRWPEVADAVGSRLLLWFSRYWLDWLEGEVIGQVTDDEHAERRRRETEERARAAADEQVAEHFGLQLQLVEPDCQAWGSYRAVELLSWLPRAPLIDVFTAWAITFAVLGKFRQFDEMAWVLRWNNEDPAEAESAVLNRAQEMLDIGGRIAREAAKALLAALATPAACKLHDAQFGRPKDSVSKNLTWASLSDGKSRKEPLTAVATLNADPLDPSLQIPDAWIIHLTSLAALTSDESLIAGDYFEAESFKHTRAVLARWAPATYAGLIRRRFAAVIRDVSAVPLRQSRLAAIWSCLIGRKPKAVSPFKLPPSVEGLQRAMLALEDADLAPWRALSARAVAEHIPAPFALHATALADASAGQQIALLLETMPEAGLPDWSARLLDAAGQSDLDTLASLLEPSRPPAALLAWINYLNVAPRDLRPHGWEPLARLIKHERADIRAATFSLIVNSDDPMLAEVVDKSGWSYVAGMSRDEAAWGSLALAMAPGAKNGSMAGRVHPDALGDLLARFPSQHIYLDAFAEHVRLELERLRMSRSRVYPHSLLTVPRGWDELVAAKRQEFLKWIDPFINGSDIYHLLFFAEEFPLLRALDVADGLIPGAKAKVVTRAMQESRSSNMRAGDLYRLATEVAGRGAEESRELALAEANNDKKLFEFAVGLQRSGHDRWLLDRINLDLAGNTAGIIARGLVLAGFLAKSEEHDEWWAAHEMPPSSGWLAEVHASAASEYRRFAHAHHWVMSYRGAETDMAALGAHELLVTAVDDRLLIGETRPSPGEISSWSWRRRLHWSANWEGVKAAMKKHRDALEKSFLASKLPLQNQAPRRQ